MQASASATTRAPSANRGERRSRRAPKSEAVNWVRATAQPYRRARHRCPTSADWCVTSERPAMNISICAILKSSDAANRIEASGAAAATTASKAAVISESQVSSRVVTAQRCMPVHTCAPYHIVHDRRFVAGVVRADIHARINDDSIYIYTKHIEGPVESRRVLAQPARDTIEGRQLATKPASRPSRTHARHQRAHRRIYARIGDTYIHQ